MGFISQCPELTSGASCSRCPFSTRLSSNKYFAPRPSSFSWLPLEPPELIMLGSRFWAALLPPSNSRISTFPGTLQGFYGMPCRAHSSSQSSPCLSPPPALSSPSLLLASSSHCSLFPLSPKNTTHVCYGSLYLQSLS